MASSERLSAGTMERPLLPLLGVKTALWKKRRRGAQRAPCGLYAGRPLLGMNLSPGLRRSHCVGLTFDFRQHLLPDRSWH